MKNLGRPAFCLGIISLLLSACSGDARRVERYGEVAPLPSLEASAGGLGFPADVAQPWEQLDGAGRVVPGSRAAQRFGWQARGTGAINAGSEFAAGYEAFASGGLRGGGSTELDMALRLGSADSGSQSAAWAVYRLPLAGAQPGAISADLNLRLRDGGSELSAYYLGVADFARSAWAWHGPFSDAQPRLLLAEAVADGADYCSPLGNAWVAVMVYDGNRCDVVGVAATPLDPADHTAPPAPGGLTAEPHGSSIELQWNDVLAADLAGYRIYRSSAPFTDASIGSDGNVTAEPLLQGQTRCILLAGGPGYFAVAAVDLSGNRSPLGAVVQSTSGPAPPLVVELTAGAPSALRGESITLTASGGASYDWDLDGDGSFDVTGDLSGTQSAETSAPGVLRPKVRATGSDATRVAMGSVSLLISANTRPAAIAFSNVQQGAAPLSVDFTGEAQDAEDAEPQLSYAWDFDGDGVFEPATDMLTPSRNYASTGLYNARFRVTDSAGAYDTATVVIHVTNGALTNQLPTADLQADLAGGTAPLAVSLDASASADPEGAALRFDWDFENDGLWDIYDAPAQLSHTFTTGGSHTVRLRVTDPAGAQDSADVAIVVNLPPVAVIGTDTPKVNPGETVFLSAAGSMDAEGPLADFEWDLDGDSIFNETGAEAAAQGNAEAARQMGLTAGRFAASLRVTDDDGAQATTSLVLTVRGWLKLTVDAADDVGQYTSLAVVNGRPAISYYDSTNGNLEYAWSSTPDGTGGWSSLTVDASGADSVGLWTCLRVINGRPAISYYDSTNSNLEYAWSSMLDGSGGWGTLTVDGGPDNAGQTNALALISGCPAISYMNDSRLAYTRSSAVDGSTGWTTSVVVDPVSSTGHYSSLAVVNGNPAISYTNGSNPRYAYSTAADGSTGWTVLDITDTGSEGTSLAFLNCQPVFSYRLITGGDLKLALSGTADGSGSWTTLTVDAPTFVGNGTSLAFIAGRPAIGYYDQVNTNLKYASSSVLNGSGGWGNATVDSSGAVGQYASLAEVNGQAAISYYDATGLDLKYALLYE